jgi:hypothetical protein
VISNPGGNLDPSGRCLLGDLCDELNKKYAERMAEAAKKWAESRRAEQELNTNPPPPWEKRITLQVEDFKDEALYLRDLILADDTLSEMMMLGCWGGPPVCPVPFPKGVPVPVPT